MLVANFASDPPPSPNKMPNNSYLAGPVAHAKAALDSPLHLASSRGISFHLGPPNKSARARPSRALFLALAPTSDKIVPALIQFAALGTRTLSRRRLDLRPYVGGATRRRSRPSAAFAAAQAPTLEAPRSAP